MTLGLVIILAYLIIALIVDRFVVDRDVTKLIDQQFYEDAVSEFGTEKAWKIANMTRNILILIWPVTLILMLVNKIKNK